MLKVSRKDFMSKKNKNISYFVISSWIQMAKDDLSVAKMETIPCFIRCYHAQQSMEKMLKAAFVISNGTFCMHSDKVAQHKQQCPSKDNDSHDLYVPDCAWELNANIEFPSGKDGHDIVKIWDKLHNTDANAFGILDDKQIKFMEKATEYATVYRYPYCRPKSETQVSRIPNEEDVEIMVRYADLLYSDLYAYICTASRS
jgi:HEPN domain-containing protein